MLQIFRKFRLWWNPGAASTGVPRRVKNYASQTGFQYQYHLQSSVPGDYRFEIWAAGYPHRTLHITVPLTEMAARDRYALAKLHLFRALDQHTPGQLPTTLAVTDPAALDELYSEGG